MLEKKLIQNHDFLISDTSYVTLYSTHIMREILQNILIHPDSYKKWQIEKDFEADIFRFLRKFWYFCYHVQDIGLWQKLLDGICIDLEGKVFFIEFKKTDWYTYNMSQFEPSQIRLLEMMLLRWTEVYIMIYSQKTKTYWVGEYEYLKSHANSVWWIKLFQ